MNFPFIVVVVAAVSGLASELALRNVAPQVGPIFALMLMAVAVLVGARLLARKGEEKRVREARVMGGAGESLHPA